jgi:hypothetical protein
MPSKTKLHTVLITQWLFFINACVWFVLAVNSILRLDSISNTPMIVLWVVIILMFANAGAMFVIGFWLGRKSKWAYFLALAVLLVNILLTFTDQVGFYDIVTVLLDFVTLGLLLYDRKSYF